MSWIAGGNSDRRRQRRRTVSLEVLEGRALLSDGITAVAGPAIKAVAGVPTSNAVFATYTVTDPSGSPGTKWRAEIVFGDGQVGKLVVPIQVGNKFEFPDTHTYTTAGNYTATIMIAVPGSHKPNDNVVTIPITVSSPQAPPPTPSPSPAPTPSPTPTPSFPSTIGNFKASGLKIQATAHKTYFGDMAYFREPNSKIHDFYALIDWGDGSRKEHSEVRDRGNCRFAVSSFHLYIKTGVFHMTVTIRDIHHREIAAQTLVRVIG
jgi:hypothetical protein